MKFEEELREALRREAAPADFAARVLARAEREGRVTALPVWRRPATWALAAGLAVAALVPPAAVEWRHRREQRALEARDELLFALRITRAKLRETKEKVQRATGHNL